MKEGKEGRKIGERERDIINKKNKGRKEGRQDNRRE